MSVEAVQKTVKKLAENNTPVFTVIKRNAQGGYLFNEAQATAIKIELQNHTKVAKNGYNTLSISNDLEAWELQKRLDAYKDRRIAELQAENEAQKQQLIEQAPKVFELIIFLTDNTIYTPFNYIPIIVIRHDYRKHITFITQTPALMVGFSFLRQLRLFQNN